MFTFCRTELADSIHLSIAHGPKGTISLAILFGCAENVFVKPCHFPSLVFDGRKMANKACILYSVNGSAPPDDGDGAAGGGGLFVKGPLTLSILTFTWEQ